MEINGFSLLDLGANYHEKSILVYGESNEIIKVPFIGVVIKLNDLIVLFDTGPNIDGNYSIMKRFSTKQSDNQHLINQLNLLNLNIKDIKLVILSHLHFDHAGGLKFFRNTNIPILIQKKELDYAYNPDWFYKDVYYRNDFDFDDLNYITINGNYKINDNLKIISLYGHTPGTQGLMYHSKNNKIIFTSDAIYTLENIQPTLRRQGFDSCTSMWGKSANKVILKNKFDNFEIYPGHDPEFYSKKRFAPYIYKE
ncbi:MULTISPECIES: N-acyl homoserine lactonase family protein [Acidiplasma]|jgi:glyoxylase-like metal-dependent hydrolase (beta-lactamase superfamily II)|uniref:Metallo-beta-lactamase domain-containing protein n=2 Tax=Acidiplasma TaxID=507753 RepID=A0A0Q0RXR5_9ARCH|nr:MULTISPECIES: N-acyl homoserine lactonase family protein [Acidiplasma]KJE49495.1 hypothetical protein TZ01_05640 [Acidiplasma sp. MBA-1]KQB34823.1 hypothetical protein AOG55_08985 [Acidiplasma cupricumulans]KQB35220.1 hypothetical protein AOG54_09190 [Acidiplasma aeolicum]WMT54520.1 MAG: N-acyl homoserine lactonase family protein [Acidiplasma sp.]